MKHRAFRCIAIFICMIFTLSLSACGKTSAEEIPSAVTSASKNVVYLEVIGPDDSVVGKGTGFLINPQVVVTCYHMITDAVKINVWSNDGSEGQQVLGVLGFDTDADIAFLYSSKEIEFADVLDLAYYEDIDFNDTYYAAGYPLDSIEVIIEEGLIKQGTTFQNHRFFLMDMNLNSGNSGSPILGSDGKVVGMVTFNIGRDDGTIDNFALISNDMMDIAESLGSETTWILSELYEYNHSDSKY